MAQKVKVAGKKGKYWIQDSDVPHVRECEYAGLQAYYKESEVGDPEDEKWFSAKAKDLTLLDEEEPVKVRVPFRNEFSHGFVGYVTHEDGKAIVRNSGIEVIVHETPTLEGEERTIRAWFLKIVE